MNPHLLIKIITVLSTTLEAVRMVYRLGKLKRAARIKYIEWRRK